MNTSHLEKQSITEIEILLIKIKTFRNSNHIKEKSNNYLINLSNKLMKLKQQILNLETTETLELKKKINSFEAAEEIPNKEQGDKLKELHQKIAIIKLRELEKLKPEIETCEKEYIEYIIKYENFNKKFKKAIKEKKEGDNFKQIRKPEIKLPIRSKIKLH
ncbi:MAG: hypothetical protein V1824_03735 [archaeon]